MRARSHILAAAASLALVCSAGPARAEPADEARAAASRADALLAAMDATGDNVRHLLRRARTQKWARAIACLDEALSRVDVALRAGREEAASAREAAREGDADLARAHLARVVRLREMARAGASYGQMCAAGPELQPFEGTSVRVTVDPRIAPVTP